eukprot:91336-Chlamydomonas_euryale.AAC.1
MADDIRHKVYLVLRLHSDGAGPCFMFVQENGCVDFSYPGGNAKKFDHGISGEQIETRLAEELFRELCEEVGYMFAGNAIPGQRPLFSVDDLRHAEKK